ncbi:unnamed protein product [Clonostachys solani]|uniref:Aminoglycoside phosphotransferase domain-containing protein n=1 Tax=Clonostachys solani TaxID=160281 RepID=A0A9P0EQ05_9HYPO|nr:unnamed protein product [Clonostachys solani]
MSTEGFDRDVFGPLVDIEESSLLKLASRIAHQALGLPEEASGRLIASTSGSYNIVHIIELEPATKIVIRVPATGWGSGLTSSEAAQALRSYGATSHFLREKTTIRVPQVFDVDTSTNNEIGAPYICTSFVQGKSVGSVWFDTATTEAVRRNILASVAENMARLSALSFESIGSIVNKDNMELGPCLSFERQEDDTVKVKASGPFTSVASYLEENTPKDKGESNVMVDDTGAITGFIDLDHSQTMPRFLGYSRYPSWITRDWDPLMYGWPALTDREDPPEKLAYYREFYSQKLNEALGPDIESRSDLALTRKSHIYEAIWIACLSPANRSDICRKLIEEALEITKDDAMDVFYELGSGEYEDEDEWPILKDNLERLCS